MSIIEYDEYRITLSPEALLLRAFSDLWKRDRTEDKEKALQEVGYIYFMYDPRSDYRKGIPDEEERMEQILRDMGFPEKWKPDKLVKKAIECYLQQPYIDSEELRALDSSLTTLRKIRNFCEEIDFMDSEDPVKTAKDIAGIIKILPDIVKSVSEARKTLLAQAQEMNRTRGNITKKLAEDGIESWI